MGGNNPDNITEHADLTKRYAVKTIDAFPHETETENKPGDFKMNQTIRTPTVMSENPGLYSHVQNKTRKDNKGIGTKYLWKEATAQQSKLNQTIEKIKEENSSIYEPLEHNRIEKRSVVGNIPAHVERFSEQDWVGADNSSTLATVSQ
jgi:hypothetical protein